MESQKTKNRTPAFNTFVGSKKLLPGQSPFVIAADVPRVPAAGGGDGVSKVFAEIADYPSFVDTIDSPENRFKNLYEVVPSMDCAVMGIFDIDRHDTVYSPREVFDSFSVAATEYIKEHFDKDFVLIPGETCQVADSTTKYRTSLHVKLEIGMRTMYDNKHFACELREYIFRRMAMFPQLLEQQDGVLDCVVDKKIYTNYRQFRMLYQAKLSQTNFFMPAFGSSELPSKHTWMYHADTGVEELWWVTYTYTFKQNSPGTASKSQVSKKIVQSVAKQARGDLMTELVDKTRYFNNINAVRTLMQGPVDVMSITELNGAIVYTLKGAMCPYANRVHHSNHVYFMMFRGSGDIQIRCHNEKCNESFSLPWTIQDISGLHTMLCDEKFAYGMHTQAMNIDWTEDYDEPEMRDLPVERIVLVRAGMGLGKTKAMHRLAAAKLCEPKAKALIVTFSRTLASKLHADFADLGFIDYLEVKGGAPLTASRIVVCLDSLWRVSTRNFDYVFIDEAVSVFLHFNSTKMERGHINSSVLELLLLQAEHMYFIDACADSTMIKHISDYFANHKGCGTHWVRNRHVRPSNRKARVETCVADRACPIAENTLAVSAMSRVMTLLHAGKNVVVCCSTKRFATTLEAYVKQERGTTSILSYYSGKSESLQNVSESWASCQLLIYSPSVSAGVSFEGDHFHALVGFLVNSPSTPSVDLSLQQLFRVRNLTDGDMFLYVQDFHADESLPHTDEQVDDMLSRDASLPNKYYLEPQLQAMSSVSIDNGLLRYDKTRMSYLIVKGIVSMRHRSLLMYRTILNRTLIEDYGIPCTQHDTFVDKELHRMDIEMLDHASKVTDNVPFENIPILCKLEHGEARYREIAGNMERASAEDKAAKLLHDYAIRLWRISPDTIDEEFHTRFVRAHDSGTQLYRAKRFMLMCHKTPSEIRESMSRMMDSLMLVNDPNIKVYRSKLKAHFTMLLIGQELLDGCLTSDQARSVRNFTNVTITDAVMCEQVNKVKSQFSSEDMKYFCKVFELKDTATTMVTFKKVMVSAFGFPAERQSDCKRMKAWHIINIKLDSIRKIKETYAPGCLDADSYVSGEPIQESQSVALQFKQCVFHDNAQHVPPPTPGSVQYFPRPTL